MQTDVINIFGTCVTQFEVVMAHFVVRRPHVRAEDSYRVSSNLASITDLFSVFLDREQREIVCRCTNYVVLPGRPAMFIA